MSQAINLRTTAANAIRRAHDRVAGADLSFTDVAQLEQEVRAITAHYDRFVQHHETLVGAAMVLELDEHDTLWDQVETLYKATCTILNRKLMQLQTSRVTEQDSSNSANASSIKIGKPNTQHLDLRLDPVKIPSFDGALHNWLAFRDTFENLVHKSELPEAYKLGKLRQSIDSEKVPLIGGMYTGGYQEVWQALKTRFDNPKLLAETHVSRLLNVKIAQEETSEALLKIVDTVQESLRALRVMKLPVDQWDALVVPIIVPKLPLVTQREWCMVGSSSEIPTLSKFLEFVEKRAQSLATEFVRPPQRSQAASNRNVRAQLPMKSHIVTTNEGSCPYCHGPHRISRCQKLLSKAPGQRFSELKEFGLCFNCLRSGHTSLRCSSSGCRQCGRKHHTMFCRESDWPGRESSLPHQQAQVTATTTTTQSA